MLKHVLACMHVCACVPSWKLNISLLIFLQNFHHPSIFPSSTQHCWTWSSPRLLQTIEELCIRFKTTFTPSNRVLGRSNTCRNSLLLAASHSSGSTSFSALAARYQWCPCLIFHVSRSSPAPTLWSRGNQEEGQWCNLPRPPGGEAWPLPSPPQQQQLTPAEVPDAHVHQRRRSRQCQRQWLTMTADTDNLCNTQSGDL